MLFPLIRPGFHAGVQGGGRSLHGDKRLDDTPGSPGGQSVCVVMVTAAGKEVGSKFTVWFVHAT